MDKPNSVYTIYQLWIR